MRRILTVVATLVVIGSSIVPVQAQKAQKANGCYPVDKCIEACSRQGGRQCNLYCQNEMARRGCR